MMHRLLLTMALGTALALGAAGCDGGEDPPPVTFKFEPKLSVIQTEVFALSCTFSVCHDGSGQAGNLVLLEGEAHANLVGVAADQENAAAEGLLRVKAGEPEESFLVMKLQATLDESKYGDIMPQGAGEGLAPDSLDVVREWIRRGALDD